MIIFRDRHLDICHLDIYGNFLNSHILLWSQTKTFTVHTPCTPSHSSFSPRSRGFSFPSFCLKYLASHFPSVHFSLLNLSCLSSVLLLLRLLLVFFRLRCLFQPFIVSYIFPYSSLIQATWLLAARVSLHSGGKECELHPWRCWVLLLLGR